MTAHNSQQPQSPTVDTAQQDAHSENIRVQARINGLLQRMLKSHALLTVRVGTNNSTYHSTLLEIDPDNGYIILDELNPRAGHRLVHPGEALIIRAIHDGVESIFSEQVIEIGRDNGIAYYRLSFPSALRYFQRRAHYRATVNILQDIQVYLYDQNQLVVKTTLHDISASGIGMRLRDLLTSDSITGHKIERCEIHFPDREIFTCELELRFIRPGPNKNFRILGARFLNLSPSHQSMIAHIVAELDRAHRKRINR